MSTKVCVRREINQSMILFCLPPCCLSVCLFVSPGHRWRERCAWDRHWSPARRAEGRTCNRRLAKDSGGTAELRTCQEVPPLLRTVFYVFLWVVSGGKVIDWIKRSFFICIFFFNIFQGTFFYIIGSRIFFTYILFFRVFFVLIFLLLDICLSFWFFSSRYTIHYITLSFYWSTTATKRTDASGSIEIRHSQINLLYIHSWMINCRNNWMTNRIYCLTNWVNISAINCLTNRITNWTNNCLTD